MTTTTLQEFTLSPDIVLCADDHDRLRDLAHAGLNMASTVADDLLYELDRASVLPLQQMPADVVRMGSTVRYRTSDGEQREVTLVFPGEADIERNRISVMTPIGAALIGIQKGQSITWTTRDGRKQVLTALRVIQPENEMPDDTPEPPSAA
ncbi:MAG: nucleoside diphosphate kinase regulator [Devosia sp.]|uniref:nucleoside diphosphate kinase regulator n=1 Tax=Devosia sp. TaxID=1871048 RepID=UPI001ACFC465|nr:nucleoside diphosphate kinase regulator [Devosia sp.]MBN9310147.1 nucleoside diphosphate kinase regulator [Devosia sp.]MBN9314586.1 nucleoside diphosphate kinase regulator [Devosia sp.]